jgi:hypothetical protein
VGDGAGDGHDDVGTGIAAVAPRCGARRAYERIAAIIGPGSRIVDCRGTDVILVVRRQ